MMACAIFSEIWYWLAYHPLKAVYTYSPSVGPAADNFHLPPARPWLRSSGPRPPGQKDLQNYAYHRAAVDCHQHQHHLAPHIKAFVVVAGGIHDSIAHENDFGKPECG